MAKKHKITLDYVKSILAEIQRTKNSDPEHAHGCRDSLYEDVLEHIAKLWKSGTSKTVDQQCEIANASTLLAEEAIKARKINLAWNACA